MNPSKTRKEGPAPIAGMLQKVLKKLGLENRYRESQIKVDWEKWVGPSVAAHAVPYRVVNKKLVVYVDNSVWLAELNRFYKGMILRKIQGEVGGDLIKEIHFKIGECPKEETD